MTTPAPSLIDFYKADHRSQYEPGTELVFSNWTPRRSRIEGIDRVVFFGLQFFIMEYLQNRWNRTFFAQPRDEVIADYYRRMHGAGLPISVEHLGELHDLGHLPIAINAVPEGAEVPIGVPALVMWNTDPRFFWLTNYLETLMSAVLWGPCTSATIAMAYRRILDHYVVGVAGGDPEFVPWQGHDFSFRGMMGVEAAEMSGAGHLLSFLGTDTVPAIDFLERYYHGKVDVIGGSVPATEHSVMSMSGAESELETYRRLITQTYPSGVVSIVSDTWDYWRVWTEVLPALKYEILQRDGVVVIRPDSGDPVKILCGDPDAPEGSPARRGSYEMAWEVFGGDVLRSGGFRRLDPHINLIYGDSITLDRCREICQRLTEQRFVPTNVFGIGSFTYQYNTRDTFGFAMKATAGVVNGEARSIFKDPATDSGEKKSARGLLAVEGDHLEGYTLREDASWEAVENCALRPVFRDGVLIRETTLELLRTTLAEQRQARPLDRRSST